MVEQLASSTPPPPIVLLVDDDVDTCEMYQLALQNDGYWVVEASDVAEAVTATQEIHPDVIVTDLGLPAGADGVSFAEGLRTDPRTAEIPVLALTGRDPASLGGSADLFTDVLVKPVLPDVLISRVREALSDVRALDERNVRASERDAELRARSERVLAQAQRAFGRRTGSLLARACPRCGATLQWSERRKLYGVTFDYYHPCPKGCGLFCFNHSEFAMKSIAE